MKKISSKKWFFYVSLMFLLCYAIFVLIAYNSKSLGVLYDVKTCGSYYLFSYLILSAVLYAVDTHTRKEPAFLTLFCLPLYTYIFIILCLISMGYTYGFYIIVTLLIILLYIISFIMKKYLIPKIMTMRNGYANILFFYVIAHLMVALYISFRILGYM